MVLSSYLCEYDDYICEFIKSIYDKRELEAMVPPDSALDETMSSFLYEFLSADTRFWTSAGIIWGIILNLTKNFKANLVEQKGQATPNISLSKITKDFQKAVSKPKSFVCLKCCRWLVVLEWGNFQPQYLYCILYQWKFIQLQFLDQIGLSRNSIGPTSCFIFSITLS